MFQSKNYCFNGWSFICGRLSAFFTACVGGGGGGGYGYFLEPHNVTKFQKIINNVEIFTTRIQRDLTYSNSPNLQGNLCPVSSRLSRIILPDILRQKFQIVALIIIQKRKVAQNAIRCQEKTEQWRMVKNVLIFEKLTKMPWKTLPTIYSFSAFTPVYIGYPTKKGIKKFVVSNCI